MTVTHRAEGSNPSPKSVRHTEDVVCNETYLARQDRSRPRVEATSSGWLPGADRQASPSLCGAEDTGVEQKPADLLSGRVIA